MVYGTSDNLFARKLHEYYSFLSVALCRWLSILRFSVGSNEHMHKICTTTVATHQATKKHAPKTWDVLGRETKLLPLSRTSLLSIHFAQNSSQPYAYSFVAPLTNAPHDSYAR